MDTPQSLADQLIAAVQAANDSTNSSIRTGQRNQFAEINNQANARGTLYSTQPGFLQGQKAVENTQKIASNNSSALQSTIGVKSNLIDTLRKVESLNKAAAELNGIQFNY